MGVDFSSFFLTSTGKGFWPKGLSIKVDYMSDKFTVKAYPCYLKGSVLGAKVQPMVWTLKQPAQVEQNGF